MFAFEHIWPPSIGHPLIAAVGSQSCACWPVQVAWQADVVVRPVWATQQTVPAGQLAAPLHLRPVTSPPPPPPPPPSTPGHCAPDALHE
jgi:hypothetical protein